MQEIISALAQVYTLEGFLTLAIGVLSGILIGALPGLSVNMAIALLFPFSYVISGVAGVNMLIGVYCGAVYGGSISAILLNTPGTPASAATVLDGYPMAIQNRQPGRALGLSTFSSAFGGIFSAVCLTFFAPLLAKLALQFTSIEFCAFALFGISIITSVSSGSMIKGVMGGVLGLLIAVIGIDPINGFPRYTFGSTYLLGGISFVPLLIGLFAFSQVLMTVEDMFRGEEKAPPVKLKRVFPTLSDLKRIFPTLIRSSLIGTLIGAIPGTGGDIASFISYNEAKRWSRHKEEFGHGVPEGIAAPESGNNAVTGGAMIPLLSLGVPGDGATAILLGAFMAKNIIPGPQLFSSNVSQAYQIFGGIAMANVCMAFFGFLILRWVIKVVDIPKRYLLPVILCLCFVGTYSYNHMIQDVFVMVAAGIVGYFAIKHDFTMSAVVIGVILGSMTESNLRRYLLVADGSLAPILQHPIAIVLAAVALISLCSPILMPAVKRIAGKLKRK